MERNGRKYVLLTSGHFLDCPYNILLLVSSLKSLYLIKDIETGICDVSHGVFECPDD